ncbi:MAG: nucleotide exchange factor GrpE [Chloroflexota bacterium]
MAKKQEKTRADEVQEAAAEASSPTAEILEQVALEPAAAEIEALQQELAGAQAKAEEYLDGWQRSRAEFANYKKRVEREQAQTNQNARGAVIKHFLEVLDDLERALKNRPQDEEGRAWASGIELVYRKLLTTLESEGVTLMQADGQFFDPNLHEAISSEISEAHESGQIIEVLQQGYLLGERVLRPAVVRVAR